MNRKIGPPRLVDTFFEVARTTAEFWGTQLSQRILKAMTPQGHGEPVLVLPGLGGHDITTTVLRDFLDDKGYKTYGWENGINIGPNAQTLQHLKDRLEQVYAAHNGKKVSLIGHSLGGIYARELARAFPDKVARVITLGSPFGAGEHPESTAPMVRKLFELFNGHKNAFSDAAIARQSLTPPPVPTTSIYTRHDGVVNWQTCINPLTAQSENVEVLASHCGLVMNPVALLVVADRLAEDVSQDGIRWRRFETLQYGPLLFPQVQAHWGHEPKLGKSAARKAIINLFLKP